MAATRGHVHRGRTPEQRCDAELLLRLIRAGWGSANPKFRRVFATMFFPDGTPEQYAAIVTHLRDDRVVPFEEGRLLSALIPGSRFVPLDGRNPIFLPDEPASDQVFTKLDAFLASWGGGPSPWSRRVDRTPGAAAAPLDTSSLSPREREVMALVIEGRPNADIADALSLSPRTVERHLSSVYAKLGLEGKAARAAAAARVSRGAAADEPP